VPRGELPGSRDGRGDGSSNLQAETKLRATGARPRRVFLSGLESLTASELRIAELAADRLTNREIAQTLFVTARTVEGHLTHVFYKLNVKDRSGLAAALASSTQTGRPTVGHLLLL
jgi:DNA-binding CsgD family transcriptional regulator